MLLLKCLLLKSSWVRRKMKEEGAFPEPWLPRIPHLPRNVILKWKCLSILNRETLIRELKRERRNPDRSSPSKGKQHPCWVRRKTLFIRNKGKPEVAAPGEKTG